MRAENAAPGAANSLNTKSLKLRVRKSPHTPGSPNPPARLRDIRERCRGRYEGHTSFFKLLYRVNYERRKT